MTEILDKVSKWGIAIVVLGYINVYLYYNYFGISIYPYLETSEIIFSFSSIIPSLAIILFLHLLMMYFDYINREHREQQIEEMIAAIKNKPLKEENKKEGWFEIILDFILKPFKKVWLIKTIAYSFAFLFCIGFLSFIFVVIGLILGAVSAIRLPDLSWELLFYAFFIVGFLMIETIIRNEKSPNKVYLIYAGAIVLFIFIRTHAAYNMIKDNKPKYTTQLLLNDGTWKKSNDSILYIGTTKQFYFYHNIKTSENIVIPTATVREVRIKELRTGL